MVKTNPARVLLTALLLICAKQNVLARDSADAISKGNTMAQVKAALGKPMGKMKASGRTTWLYKKGDVTFTNGAVSSFSLMSNSALAAKTALRQKREKEEEAKQKAERERQAQLSQRTRSAPPKQYSTIAHRILKLEADMGARASDKRILDNLIASAEAVIKTRPKRPHPKTGQPVHDYSEKDVHIILRQIHSVLKAEGYRYAPQLFLFKALRTKRIDCDTCTMIYTGIGDALDLPIYAVCAPRHAFVRWNFWNGTGINWETTLSSEIADVDDGYYYYNYKISCQGANNRVFLRTIDDKGLIALHFYTRGIVLEKDGNVAGAIAAHAKAISLNDKIWWSYKNRGRLYEKSGSINKALADYGKAIALNPTVPLCLTRAKLWQKRGKLDKAIKDYTTAIEMEPATALYARRAELFNKQGNLDKAIKDCDSAIRLEMHPRRTEISNKSVMWKLYHFRGTLKKKRNSMADSMCARSDLKKAKELRAEIKE